MCHECDRERRRDRGRKRSALPEEKARQRLYDKRPEVIARKKITTALWRARNLEKVREAARKKRHKLGIVDPELVDPCLAAQGFKCAICQRPDSGGKRYWQADHDHTTGLLRGVLCVRCNPGLGALGDSIERLEAAIAYLKNPPANALRK